MRREYVNSITVAAVGAGNGVLGDTSRQNQVGFSYHTMQWQLLARGTVSLETRQDRVR